MTPSSISPLLFLLLIQGLAGEAPASGACRGRDGTCSASLLQTLTAVKNENDTVRDLQPMAERDFEEEEEEEEEEVIDKTDEAALAALDQGGQGADQSPCNFRLFG